MQHIQEILASITDPGMKEACMHLWQTVQRAYVAENGDKQRTGTPAAADQPAPAVLAFPVQWPDDQRGIPSALLRSALFGVVRRGRRRALEGEVIAAWKGVTLRYTGFRLDQADLDVYLEVLHLAQKHGELGRYIPCSVYGILKAIGRHTGKSQHEWLKRAMRRLAGLVEITIGHLTYAGPLLEEFCLDEERGCYLLKLNPKLARLFIDNYTLLASADRQRLRGDLTKWLHGYVCSHQATPTQPHRIGLDKLRELCGAEVTSRKRKWREEVKKAMAQLERLRVVVAWQIVNDVLEFIRPSKGLSG